MTHDNRTYDVRELWQWSDQERMQVQAEQASGDSGSGCGAGDEWDDDSRREYAEWSDEVNKRQREAHMAEWWFHVIHKCKGCGATWDEYDPSGGGYDSGLSSCPVVVEECEECYKERLAEDLRHESEADEAWAAEELERLQAEAAERVQDR